MISKNIFFSKCQHEANDVMKKWEVSKISA